MAWKPDYVSLEQGKKWVRVKALDEIDDAEIAIIITAASRAVDKHTHRQFGATSGAETRYYTAWYDDEDCRWIVPVDDFMTAAVAGLVVVIDGVTTTDYTIGPANADKEGKPFEYLAIASDAETVPTGTPDECAVTANPWGWTAVPSSVTLATRIQLARWFKRRDAPFGIAGSPERQLRLLSALDPDVGVALADLVRHDGMVG